MKRLFFLIVMTATTAAAQQSLHGPIKLACEVCHSTDTWTIRTDAAFNHNSTGFALVGRHQSVECRACHENLAFTGKNTDCASCHADIHQNELGPNCIGCHTTQSWVVADMREKHQETRFPLLGNHRLINCEECHTRASSHRFAGTPISCITCHKKEYDATNAPNHISAGFGVECSTCHRISAPGWPGGFDHNLTAFPLTGAHRAVICAECHMNNTFESMPSKCYDCHAADFRRPVSPNHVTGNFSQECQSCHTTSAWQPASFDHNQTQLPLTGAHTTIQCNSCHINGDYQLTYANCYQCHQTEYAQPTDPNHVAANFDHNCATCHTTTAWTPSTLDHDGLYFRIYSGTHRGQWATCATCHDAPTNYAQFTCFNCHTHDKTVTDGHHTQVSGYSYTSPACYNCHRGF